MAITTIPYHHGDWNHLTLTIRTIPAHLTLAIGSIPSHPGDQNHPISPWRSEPSHHGDQNHPISPWRSEPSHLTLAIRTISVHAATNPSPADTAGSWTTLVLSCHAMRRALNNISPNKAMGPDGSWWVLTGPDGSRRVLAGSDRS